MKTLYLLAFFETSQLGKVGTNGVQQRFRQSQKQDQLFTARSRLGSPDTHPTDQAPSHPQLRQL
jgi:hypothetical protein